MVELAAKSGFENRRYPDLRFNGRVGDSDIHGSLNAATGRSHDRLEG